MPAERWPPVYSEADLEASIREAMERSKTRPHAFYDEGLISLDPMQGDIILLGAGVPYLDEAGQAAVREESTPAWLVLANTCDLCREIAEVPFVPLAPIRDELDLGAEMSRSIENYQTSRTFHLPPWDSDVGGPGRVVFADLTATVHVHRAALGRPNQRLSRLTLASWMLLNACLVRYQARSDGRET